MECMNIKIKVPFQKRYLTIAVDNIPPWLVGVLATSILIALMLRIIPIHL